MVVSGTWLLAGEEIRELNQLEKAVILVGDRVGGTDPGPLAMFLLASADPALFGIRADFIFRSLIPKRDSRK